ncbi:NAD-dependent epimerase/dehydratase family protein [Pseudomonas sp.]|uniref:NAD-dependent epimerase/dehydratase family protein n=1 Tax=Pseudomonas sp. TaxID=306 RepID=UPI003242ABFF
MKVLITGGAGFIGSALAIALTERGDEVTVLDNMSPQIHGLDPENSSLVKRLPKSVRLLKGDVRSREDWERALPGQEVVVHLAAETGTGQSMYEIDRYVDVNIRGTSLMLDILAKQEPGSSSVRRLVVASSRAIYGEGKYKGSNDYIYPEARSLDDLENGIFECRDPSTGELATPVPTDENSKIHPSSIYGITKQVQEQLVLTAAASLGIGAAALRYQNVYGPGQSLKNPYTGILSIFSTLLLQGKDINIFEDGKESRDFVYIDDVVAATIATIDSNIASASYNVGTGEATDVLTVAHALKENYQSGGEIKVSGNFRIGDIRHNIADQSKLTQDTGFTPKISFAEGLKAFSDWVRTQEISDSGYEKSVNELRSKGLLK